MNYPAKLTFNTQPNPNLQELASFFTKAFSVLDSDQLKPSEQQELNEWFSLPVLSEYITHGSLIEARLSETLVGAVFVAKHNPLTWPDGHKAEIFILAVNSDHRNQGIGKKLLTLAEQAAIDFGARSVLINSHQSLTYLHEFYQSQGYSFMGKLENYYDNGSAIFLQKTLV